MILRVCVCLRSGELQLPVEKGNFDLISATFIPPVTSACRETRLGRCACRSERKGACPTGKNKMNIQARLFAWVYSARMHTSELQAVMAILPPRFSCTVLLNVPRLGRGRVITCKD